MMEIKVAFGIILTICHVLHANPIVENEIHSISQVGTPIIIDVANDEPEKPKQEEFHDVGKAYAPSSSSQVGLPIINVVKDEPELPKIDDAAKDEPEKPKPKKKKAAISTPPPPVPVPDSDVPVLPVAKEDVPDLPVPIKAVADAAASVCRDKRDTNACKYFQSKNYCKVTYVQYMKTNCASTCGYCGGGSGNSGTNSGSDRCAGKTIYSNCDTHVNNGYCKTFPDWMEKHCCGKCAETGTDSTGSEESKSNCKPKYSNCQANKDKGYCEKFYDWMQENCCGLCKDSRVYLNGGQSGQAGCLNTANHFRRLHIDTPDQSTSTSLAAASKQWAQHLLQKIIASGGHVTMGGNFYHDDNRGNVGENLAYKTYYKQKDESYYCQDANQMWYDEIKDYRYSNPTNPSGVVGHFTQVVWKNSYQVGFGTAVGKDPQADRYIVVTVARYSPAGNMNTVEAHTSNVKPKKGN